MTRILTFLFLFLSTVCNSQDTIHDYYLSRIVHDKNITKVQHAINTDSLMISKNAGTIDRCILIFLTNFQKSPFRLADPDQSFNATDIVDDSLPDRQLQIMFKNKNNCILIYAHGGVGFHYHIAWFELKNNLVNDFWICNSFYSYDNIHDLRNFINSFDRIITLKNGRRILPNSICL